MADKQAASKKNSGKNASTSDLRKTKYLRYKGKHGGKQRSHPESKMRSPLVRKAQRRQVLMEYSAGYIRMVDLAVAANTPVPAVDFAPKTIRMMRANGVSEKRMRAIRKECCGVG